jgi:hypothetical protein
VGVVFDRCTDKAGGALITVWIKIIERAVRADLDLDQFFEWYNATVYGTVAGIK